MSKNQPQTWIHSNFSGHKTTEEKALNTERWGIQSFARDRKQSLFYDWRPCLALYSCYHFPCNNVDWWNAIITPGVRRVVTLSHGHYQDIIIAIWWPLWPAPAVVTMLWVSSQQHQQYSTTSDNIWLYQTLVRNICNIQKYLTIPCSPSTSNKIGYY